MPPSQPIKILFVITQGQWGGAQRYVFDLATNLPKNFSAAVVMGAEDKELNARLNAKNIPVIFARYLRRNIHPLADLAAIWELRKIFKSQRPDIVHLNSSKAGVIGSIAARLAGIHNVIFTAHGFAFLEPNSWSKHQIYYWAERFATLFRRKIICVSDFDRQAAIKSHLGPAEKFMTIHNGIILPSLSTSYKLQATSSPIIGTIAHLYKTKGLEYLVQASRDVDAHFEVIGEGPERRNLEFQISKFKLQNKFKLLGTRENTTQHLQQFDIFVLSSVKEGLPYTLLEAMAAGRPIIATSVGGIPELIRDGQDGLLVAPADSKVLTKAIQSLIDDPEKAKSLGASARERIKDFSLDKMLAETIKIYNSSSLL